jgi:hypothetical protein
MNETILEMAIEIAEVDRITVKTVESIAPSKYMIFSRDMHFDLASSFQGMMHVNGGVSGLVNRIKEFV